MKLRNLRCLLLLLFLLGGLSAQTRVDLANQGRGVDFSAATATKPSKTGSAFPATCSVGETFFKLNAAAGKNLFACTAANTWTALSPALDVPTVSGMSGKVMSTDGSTPTWTAPAGDVIGAVSNLTVSKIQGRPVSSAAPQNGNVLSWNSVLSQWQPAAGSSSAYVAGSGVAIAGGSVSLDSATVPQYSMGSGAPLLACDTGRDLYTDVTNGNLYFCNATNSWQLLSRAGHVHAASDISGTLNLSQGGTNQATWVAGRCVQVASDGTRLESAASACGPRSSTGSGAPSMACTAGQDIYTDTTAGNLYYCSTSNAWTLLSRTSHAHAASDVTSGTLALARGGTNQATWIAGRCVQVKSDGTTLESAAAACGPRTTTGTVAPSASCTAGQDIYTDTTAGNLYYCSATNIWTLLSRNGHAHAASDVTSGTLALARGGTNQATWIAGRCVQVKSDGTTLESAAAACGPRTTIGTVAPSASCTAGQDIYTDTSAGNLYYCSATNTWTLLSSAGHTHAASDLTSGTISLARGGTNQATWTPGRCVQVKADGTTLESASAACGSGGSSPTVVVDLLTTASSSPYTFPTGLKYFNVFFCGGGGGGAGSLTNASGGGGGGAGCEEGVIYLNGGTTMSFTMGAGGGGGAAGAAGSAGGSTTFTVGGYTYTVTGGSGGLANGTGGNGGRGYVISTTLGNTVGGSTANATRRDQGGQGGAGRNTSTAPREGGYGSCVGGAGGSYNTGASATVTTAMFPVNGTSAAGGSGAPGATSAGTAATSCNGGGGGGTDTATTNAGGAGGSGYIRLSYSY